MTGDSLRSVCGKCGALLDRGMECPSCAEETSKAALLTAANEAWRLYETRLQSCADQLGALLQSDEDDAVVSRRAEWIRAQLNRAVRELKETPQCRLGGG